ncbi:hypothetical protein [Limosilactobacillus fastidiosus]|uniref:Uncharacterized protein n=1 Tax=Limosilactobacillus fastidiosus TaxID=2759855 RepID=A0A7W3TZM2_9LACO|nr:hypothetical protein [Limosilactobacillus fastidiosus]
MVAGLALLLAGCGTQRASKSQDSENAASSSSLLAIKSSEKMSADNLSPQQSVSLVAAYAGNKYGNDWASMTKKAERQGLKVNLYPTSKYKLSDNGQGVAYDVTTGGKSTGLIYTIDNDDVNLYQNVKVGKTSNKIATVSKQDMVKYINDKGQAKLVGNLAKSAQVVDKRTESAETSSNGDTTSHQYGREGKVTVPTEMQGTWYSADHDSNSTITFGKNTLTSDGNTSYIYKQNPSFLSGDQTMNRSVQDATEDWVSGKFIDLHGLHYLNIRGWCQNAGDGSSFAVHTETINGKEVKVLVTAGGAGFWTDGVYYQNKDTAQQQADKKFAELYYMDDDD